jgi:hypothetical protein
VREEEEEEEEEERVRKERWQEEEMVAGKDVKKVEEVVGVPRLALPLDSLRAMAKGKTAIFRKMHVGMTHFIPPTCMGVHVAGKQQAARRRTREGVSRAQGVRAAGGGGLAH